MVLSSTPAASTPPVIALQPRARSRSRRVHINNQFALFFPSLPYAILPSLLSSPIAPFRSLPRTTSKPLLGPARLTEPLRFCGSPAANPHHREPTRPHTTSACSTLQGTSPLVVLSLVSSIPAASRP